MPEKERIARKLFDRRNQTDRRLKPILFEEEKRDIFERRSDHTERRSSWIRTTEWSSVFVDLLR
ncbi:hypothetical protein [Desulfoluna sp.]|uniref:hypothetical protein n=1 Tax=Desulfoluna sp. TaxID=2045199 RepID=UPI002631D915|nr:hypothetical protein [Desulfoluna sp.]